MLFQVSSRLGTTYQQQCDELQQSRQYGQAPRPIPLVFCQVSKRKKIDTDYSRVVSLFVITENSVFNR